MLGGFGKLARVEVSACSARGAMAELLARARTGTGQGMPGLLQGLEWALAEVAQGMM